MIVLSKMQEYSRTDDLNIRIALNLGCFIICNGQNETKKKVSCEIMNKRTSPCDSQSKGLKSKSVMLATSFGGPTLEIPSSAVCKRR